MNPRSFIVGTHVHRFIHMISHAQINSCDIMYLSFNVCHGYHRSQSPWDVVFFYHHSSSTKKAGRKTTYLEKEHVEKLMFPRFPGKKYEAHSKGHRVSVHESALISFLKRNWKIFSLFSGPFHIRISRMPTYTD